LDAFTSPKIESVKLYDSLPNSIGWMMVSERVATVLRDACGTMSIEVLRMPNRIAALSGELGPYYLIGVKKRIACLDIGNADVSSFDDTLDGHAISAIHKCVIKLNSIPEDCNVFHVAEYPYFAVVDDVVMGRLCMLKLAGLVFEEIET